MEDTRPQVRICHHLRARGVRGVQAHRYPGPGYPGLPGYQDEERTFPGQGGFTGRRTCSPGLLFTYKAVRQ